jgi:L-fucose isomerase-like protein
MTEYNNKLHIVFFPLARTTFFMPAAEENFRLSCDMLREVFGEVVCPETLLTSPEMLAQYADSIFTQPDLVIYQCGTFIGADFVTEITRRFSAPIIVWSVKEPSIDGGRLKLNSLTGAFSASNSLYRQERKYRFLLGNPGDPALIRSFRQTQAALEIIKQLGELVVGVVGTQPPGFEFGAVDEALLSQKLGTRIVGVEVAGILKMAAAYPQEAFSASLTELKERTKGWESVPVGNLEKYARLRTAYQAFIDENGIKAIASRCWPDFFTEYGVPVCAVFSLLNDCGIATSCETDTGGAISMFIGAKLTNKAVYFGDPVAIDEKCNAIVFWHCGAGATSLAREKEGATLGVHPNRKIGPTLEFGLKSGPVTVLRLGKSRDGFRLLAMKGEALDEPQKFYGTSVAVRPSAGDPAATVEKFVKDGWEPHFVVAYGDILEELRLMSDFLQLDFFEYR